MNYSETNSKSTSQKNAENTGLVAINRQEYEYIQRLLLLYKANLRRTGECHYSPILNLIKQKT